MGGGHDHGLSAGAHHRWRLVAVFGMVSTFFVVELAYGIIAGSLALISDAGHMATDVVALGAALAATKLARAPCCGPFAICCLAFTASLPTISCTNTRTFAS